MYRLINLVSALLLLVIFTPVIVVVVIAIRLDSRDQAIFKQTRVGQFNRLFTIYKFRTMRADMPDLPSERVLKDDRHFTRLGKILRRFSIDELPQLFNIICGDMNFIGPRPALYNQEALIAMRKASGVSRLKPGITGWAQVNGREMISLEQKVKLDKYYLDNRSWRLDLNILWLTIVKSLSGTDLYLEKPGRDDGLLGRQEKRSSSL